MWIILKKALHFKVKGKTWSMFLFLLFRWNWDPSMSHSIVCHHVVCCGQMNQESWDTLLLIWRCSLTVQTQHMALTTSWHSGPAVDYRPANICLQLFNNFHGHLKSPEPLNRWREGPPLGVSCMVLLSNKLSKDFFMILGLWYMDRFKWHFWSMFNLLFRSDSPLKIFRWEDSLIKRFCS